MADLCCVCGSAAGKTLGAYCIARRPLGACSTCGDGLRALGTHYGCRWCEDERTAALRGEVERLRGLLRRERTGLAEALGDILSIVASRAWIEEGRGPYEWDDERYKAEAGAALREVRDRAALALRASGDTVTLGLFFDPERDIAPRGSGKGGKEEDEDRRLFRELLKEGEAEGAEVRQRYRAMKGAAWQMLLSSGKARDPGGKR